MQFPGMGTRLSIACAAVLETGGLRSCASSPV